MAGPRGNERGVSLIELMVAMAIFTIGLLSLSALQIGAATGNEDAGNLTMATNLATSKLDAMRLANYFDFSNGQTGTEYYDRFGGENPATADRHFTLVWQVTGSTEVLDVTVQVVWMRGGNKQRRVQLQGSLFPVRPS